MCCAGSETVPIDEIKVEPIEYLHNGICMAKDLPMPQENPFSAHN
jgi:hypothetical protein